MIATTYMAHSLKTPVKLTKRGRRILGDPIHRPCMVLELLAAFVCQPPHISPADYANAAAYTKAARAAYQAFGRCRMALTHAAAIHVPNQVLVEEAAGRAIELRGSPDTGYSLRFTERQGANYRRTTYQLVERAIAVHTQHTAHNTGVVLAEYKPPA
jgi:hypothetical protein